MANGDTKTNQYLDIAANGTRADLPTDTCCETRSQTLIREVAERIMDVEDEVERLENNPDVADIVATYADLQSYDTSQLTDKDVIRVLQDETHDGDSTYYRWSTSTSTWTYIGESKQYTDFVGTDGTNTGEAGLVPAPAITDVDKFLSASGDWEEIASGGIIELTTADYNYDYGSSGSYNCVALWLLEPGVYSRDSSVVVRWADGSSNILQNNERTVFVTSPVASGSRNYIIMDSVNTSASIAHSNSSGGEGAKEPILMRGSITQTTGTATDLIMSQNATTSMVFADPSTKTKVNIGGLGASPNSVAIGKNAYSGDSNSGSGSVAIGNSANTYSGSSSVAIGNAARARAESAISIGYNAGHATTDTQYEGAISLGAYSEAHAIGEMNIGSTNTTFGYNNSNYRLISGVYDPQTAHDAATKGYVDTAVAGAGGGVTELTSADYNYPTDNPTSIALWLLDPGVYVINQADANSIAVKTTSSTTATGQGTYIVGELAPTTNRKNILQIVSSKMTLYASVDENGENGTVRALPSNVVQSTGTSTTDVMSQNAVTSMVFNDPSTAERVQIGGTSSAYRTVAIGKDSQANSARGVAIGEYARASGPNAIAIGGGSAASVQGEMNIGTPLRTGIGYNNSDYRLLTGLYDPQSDHDAATKGYVDGLVGDVASALNAINNGGNS